MDFLGGWSMGGGTGLGASALPMESAFVNRWLDSFGELCTWDYDNPGADTQQ